MSVEAWSVVGINALKVISCNLSVHLRLISGKIELQ